jgi:hypothetical protein
LKKARTPGEPNFWTKRSTALLRNAVPIAVTTASMISLCKGCENKEEIKMVLKEKVKGMADE